MKRIVAITGGIGSGKSVVSRMLRSMGYDVYDCDIEAKILMDHDPDIKRRIADEFSAKAINADGSICRPFLSERVFSDSDKLKTLNDIVHGAVRKHFRAWVDKQNSETVFVETAILYESGMNKLVNEVWEVTAPKEVRIQRVMRRNAMKRDDIEKRIASQSHIFRSGHRRIDNDGLHSVIPQIIRLLHSHDQSNS